MKSWKPFICLNEKNSKRNGDLKEKNSSLQKQEGGKDVFFKKKA